MRIPLPRPPLTPAAAARRWSEATLARARRNAMVELTALVERRSEREDAEAVLAEAVRRRGTVSQQRRSADGS